MRYILPYSTTHWPQMYLLCLLLFSGNIIFDQAIPENNSLVCPGNVLQYTCTTIMKGSLGWLVGSEHYTFSNDTDLNMVYVVGPFNAILTAVDGKKLSSTLTDTMITSADNGLQIQCLGGGSTSQDVKVSVAGLFVL